MMEKILAAHKPPISIFVVNDKVALGVLRYCRQRGLCIPEDVAIAGFSDIDILEDYGIGLTTVHIPAARMGENAFKLLVEMKNTPKVPKFPPVITLPVNLVVRESTKKIA